MRLRAYYFVSNIVLKSAHYRQSRYQCRNADAYSKYAYYRCNNGKHPFTAGKQISNRDESFKPHNNNYIKYYGFTRLGIRSQKKGIKGYPELISKVESADIFSKNKIDKTRKQLDIPLDDIKEDKKLKIINLELKNG